MFLSVLVFAALQLCAQKQDTIWVKEREPVLLLFDSEFDGELGNQDYQVVPKGNVVKIQSKVKNTVPSFLYIKTLTDNKEYVFILAYKGALNRFTYDFRKEAQRSIANDRETLKFTSSTKEVAIGDLKLADKSTDAPVDKTKKSNMSLFDSLRLKAERDAFSFGIYAIKKNKLMFKLTNVFVYENYFVFKLRIENQSSVKFNLGVIDIFLGEGQSLIVKNLTNKTRLKIFKSYPEVGPGKVQAINSGDALDCILITETKLPDGHKNLFFVISTDDQLRSLEVSYPRKQLDHAKKIVL